MDLSLTEEQDALVDTAREFTRKEIIPKAGHFDETGEFPREILKKAWETGLMNIEIPEAYGGLGGSCLDNCLVQEEVSFGCSGINTSMAANSLGAMPLLVAGTDEQKKKYLARLTARVRRSARTAAREPDAGSDVAGMRTRVDEARRRLRAQRPEALDHERRRRRLLHRVRDVRSGDEAQGHRVLRRRREHAGRQGGPQGEQDGPARLEHDRRDLRGRARSRRARSSAPRTAASRSR